MLLCPNFCFKTHWFQTTAFRRESTIVWPYLWAYFTSLYTINMIYLGTCSSCTYEKLFPYARYHICARYVMYARSLARHFKNCRYLLLSSKRYNLLFAKLFLWFQECLLNIYYLKTTFLNLHFFLSFCITEGLSQWILWHGDLHDIFYSCLNCVLLLTAQGKSYY